MFNLVKRIGTCLIALLLVLLFTLPSGYLSRYSDEALRQIAEAEAAAGRGDAEAVRKSVASLQRRTEEAARVLRLTSPCESPISPLMETPCPVVR